MQNVKSRKNLFIKGNRIYLRALSIEDADGNYRYWLNDPEINTFNSHGRFPQSVEKLKDYIKEINIDQRKLVFAVIDLFNDNHIGNISLQNINWIDRNVEIAFLLGEKDYHGKGVMFEAGYLMIKHAFDILNLHRVYCGTSSENLAMQKLAKKLGMIEEGRRRECLYKNGKYFDIIEFGILNNYEKIEY